MLFKEGGRKLKGPNWGRVAENQRGRKLKGPKIKGSKVKSPRLPLSIFQQKNKVTISFGNKLLAPIINFENYLSSSLCLFQQIVHSPVCISVTKSSQANKTDFIAFHPPNISVIIAILDSLKYPPFLYTRYFYKINP